MTEFIIPASLILAGLLALGAGGEMLVRGASRLAVAARITPLVIGLTVVAFGTSSPELAVSLKASLAGQTDIAVGNVVGSNILNILLILGISALISPLAVSSQLIRLDVPLMIGASILVWVLGRDGNISRTEGILMFAGLVCYIGWSVYQSRREVPDTQQQYEQKYAIPRDDSWRPVCLQIGLVDRGLGRADHGGQVVGGWRFHHRPTPRYGRAVDRTDYRCYRYVAAGSRGFRPRELAR